MRWKPLLFSAAFAMAAAPAHAQFLGQTTIVTPGPGVVMGAPTVFAPTYGTTVVSPYSVVAPAAPMVVRRQAVLAPTVYGAPTVFGAPAVVASPVIPGPVLMSPGVTVVRPGMGWGPGFGPRPWGWRRW